MKQSFKITHNGSRYTRSYFRDEKNNTIIVTVFIDSGMYGHNALLYYKHYIEVIKYRCRNKEFKYTSSSYGDNRYKNYITKQQLYEAYHNHWNKINPFRLFSSGSINSDLVFNDDVRQLKADINHKLY